MTSQDTIIQDIPIYVINFNDENRKERMIWRFSQIGLQVKFVNPVTIDDSRIQIENPLFIKRTSSIMLQHLDSIRDFIENSNNNYCIVCEDDILISKNFNKDLPNILRDFNELNLDILLLGFLYPNKIEYNNKFILLRENKYAFYNYPNDLWGSQMYLISRKHGEQLLKQYTIEFALNNLNSIPFNPDWTITKTGNKALIYPMIAVEEGNTKTEHAGQNSFHDLCFKQNYRDGIHI